MSLGPNSRWINAKNLQAGYEQKVALQNIEFAFARQKTTVIVGPGGSGKTTLLRTLGSEPDHRPALWVRGSLELPTDVPTWCAQTPKPQSQSLQVLLQNASLSLETAWQSVPQCSEYLRQHWLEPLDTLSPEVNRLAMLSLVLAKSPSYLLLDEPDFGASANTLSWIQSRIQSLQGQATLIITTHNLNFARTIAHFGVFLLDGAIIEAGPAAQFFSQPQHERTRRYLKWGS